MYQSLSADQYRKHIELPDGYHVDGLLVCGTWDLYAEKYLGHLTSALGALGIAANIRRLEHPDVGHAYELTIKGKVYWFVPVMGTAVMSPYVHVASLLGSKKNILVGVVGGLAPGMRTADFVLPTATKGNENARMYQRDAKNLTFLPDPDLAESLKRRLPQDIRVFEGPTITCEVMLAETEEDVEEWSAAGYLGVEMEAALVFAVSYRFKVPAAALLFVADNLIGGETMLHDDYALSKEVRQKSRLIQYEAAVAELLDLDRSVEG